ncbi:DUF1330 domain-containing protein [Streptomyces sp. NPDC004647]|uniref:DUF1330 domain-containing protein n=1 Tax=Streptomyces sp. NPDC004647 TaxID=3154671 RepID=UPI0033B43A13
MDALLERVLEAHGGLDRWRDVSTLSARITYGGPSWEFKRHADFTAPYGGEWLATDAEVQLLEGARPGSVALLGLPDMAKAKAWYSSSGDRRIRAASGGQG